MSGTSTRNWSDWTNPDENNGRTEQPRFSRSASSRLSTIAWIFGTISDFEVGEYACAVLLDIKPNRGPVRRRHLDDSLGQEWPCSMGTSPLLIHDRATDYRHSYPRLENLGGRDRHNVVRQDNEVREFAGLDRTFVFFLKGCIGRSERPTPESLLPGKALFGKKALRRISDGSCRVTAA